MKRFLPILGLLVAGCSATSDGGYVTIGNIRVNPVSEDVFEVAARPGGNMHNQLWCGAGNYARQVLGAPPNARIYVVGEAGPAVTSDSRDAAQFSLKPSGQAVGASGRKGGWGPRIGEDEFVGDASRYCSAINDAFLFF
ncbi:hypothetical protein J7382_16120 [Shimia sp. R11_0]|uniref:hypothetical protein n=1 Tax=Shimia sp. R11_0 TaxID=2821096 RepID=UPI001ADCACF1|nr:hypothetical protein [Shimia sp. R11_0]MBO9479075.1 hypothetical protein [Shimia sp. R11_0]